MIKLKHKDPAFTFDPSADKLTVWNEFLLPLLKARGLDNKEFYKTVPSIGSSIEKYIERDGGLFNNTCRHVLKQLGLKIESVNISRIVEE